MSYLEMQNGIPNFKKAVVSFWFRVPKELIEAAHAEPDATDTARVLEKCIPLLTFGKQQHGLGLGAQQGNVAAGGATVTDTVGFTSVIPAYPLAPCHIAIDCLGENPRLQFNIQMDTVASGTNIFTSHSCISVSASQEGSAAGELFVISKIPGSGVTSHAETRHQDGYDAFEVFFDSNTLLDFSADYMAEQPEYFLVETTHEIEPDQWHHLLLSFDVSGAIAAHGPETAREVSDVNYFDNGAEGVGSYAMLWYAIDDVDYRGRATPEEYQMFANSDNPDEGFLHRLGPFSVDYGQPDGRASMNGAPAGDPNGILTQRGFDVSTSGNAMQHNLFIAPTTYDYTPAPIPSKDDEMGLPGSTRYVSHIYHVEMAEFQMWTGQTLDTGDTSNRRAFISDDGKPVPPAKQSTADDPGSGSIELLGKPDVMLHGSGSWIKGRNTGKTGIDDEGEPIADGQFTPVAAIKSYKPDPSLHGPQRQ